MSEVRYSVNGKYFKDFGTYISSSDGLFDALKRKKVPTYDWAEYHGSAPDLSNAKFEQREITLKGFVTGSNWEIMKSNFDGIVSEFQKVGTQRLLIEPFGLKPLPYEVCMIDEVHLQKEFKEGKMVALFNMKLIEPNPIKKVLKLTGFTLNLSYDCPTETEIFYGNGWIRNIANGNVSLSNKTLANRVLSGYGFAGRNLAQGTDFKNNKVYAYWNTHDSHYNEDDGSFSVDYVQPDDTFNDLTSHTIPLEPNTTYTASFLARGEVATDYDLDFYVVESDDINPNLQDNWQRFKVNINGFNNERIKRTFTTTETTKRGVIYFRNVKSNNGSLFIKDVKLERGATATAWSPAPEDEKYIVIAGNVEEITNLNTNAEVVWQKL